MLSSVWQIHNKSTLKFNFRTDLASGVLFFARGGEGIYFYIALIQNSLYFEFSNGVATGGVTFQRPNLKLCDGNWYRVTVVKNGQEATIVIDGYGHETAGNSSHVLVVSTSGELFMGGIPEMSEAQQFIKRHDLNIPLEGLYQDITPQGIRTGVQFIYADKLVNLMSIPTNSFCSNTVYSTCIELILN